MIRTLAAGLLALVSLAPWPAAAIPIQTQTALTAHEGGVIVRSQYRTLRATGDPTAADRELRVRVVPTAIVYGLTARLNLFAIVPYVDTELRLDTPAGRLTRGATGLGDVTTFAKGRVWTRDGPGWTRRFSLIGGLEWPTGDFHRTDALGEIPRPLQPGSGSYDPLAGAIVTWQTLGWQLDADAVYRRNTERAGFEGGDTLDVDLAAQRRLRPRRLPERGVPAYLNGVLELGGRWAGKDAVDGRGDPDSGGHTLQLSPGIQWVGTRWLVEAGLQVPVVQDLNGDGLESDYALTVGARWQY
jgi:hypothetical protein